ncbi:amino acid adenylation domain-containing protein [Methylobacterium sp. J-068]|uniref:amino acid adenylation domain-containing protein n=1 Tax=Methylobacterium sp. J-068 TaxID=2836649 RepID=UPI001FBB94C1|nr:amino acid adenylation domain-containing protein [Methylobacterium sp. J-068]MCJ2036205.1 amino acid adenylation domain-containing protein [Methylobacterium sp. J-068]
MSAAIHADTREPEAGDADSWPLGPEQRARLRADGTAPVLTLEMSLPRPVDGERLRRSLDAVAAAHDSLRTAFATAPGYRGLRQSRVDAPAGMSLAGGTLDPARGRTLVASLRPETGRLVLDVDGLAADRGSLARLAAQIAEAYAADVPLRSEAEAVTYAHFIAWRDAVAADDPNGEAAAYWREHAGAGAAPLRLPYRRPAGRAASDPPIRETRFLESSRADRLTSALARPDLQPSGAEAVLQAAWWLLLGRIAGRTTFVAGWRHDCRRDYEVFTETLGVFEKILPLGLAFDARVSVADLAADLAQRLDAHRGFQEHWPVDAPGRADHRVVGFALAPAPRPGAGAPPDDIRGPSDFELCLEATLAADGRLVALALEADGALYDNAALALLLDQYETLLAHLPDHAATAFPDVPVIGTAERARLLAFGRPGPDPRPAVSLPERVARHARDIPAAPALTGGDGTLTYAELEDRVAALGAWLAGRGVAPEAVVALDMARSVDLVVAILAVWRAGGAYLPLDPSWPPARRRHLADLAGAVLTLSDTEARPEAGVHHLGDVLDALGPERRPFEAGAALDRMACLLFTSGSTGTPKGVVIEHAQIAAYTPAVSDALGLERVRRFGLTSTVAADLGNTMLFAALHRGACLAVADAADMADGPAFLAFLRRQAVDGVKLVPSHLAALLDEAAPPEDDTGLLPGTLILGGEATPPAFLDRLRALAPATRIANHYGPTEACVGVLVHAVDGDAADESPPLTRVLAGSEAYILDARGDLVPTGAEGILHLGGAQLCRGYLPGTAGADAAFVANPFGPGRLYRTGDRARYRPSGGLVLAGRADEQVKVRGFRIEPGEVAAVLAGLDGVRQAAVRAWPAPDGTVRLAAYVVAGADATTDMLAAALAERLPGPMRPMAIVGLDALPRLPNGKIDRTALPEPAWTGGFARIEPRTALEAVLADAMADLLGRPGTIGATDDFFEAGGHSLLVIKLVARIRKQLRVEVPPGIVFDARSPEALARALGRYAAPERLEETAQLRRELAALSEAERAALLDPHEATA